MPSVEELLSQDSEVVETYADTGIEYCTVDDDTRLVTVPDKYKKLGVESDEKAKRIWFRFPKLVGNNGVDLSAIGVRVNFRNANGDGDIYIVEDLTTDGDYVTFSWELTRKVTAYKGNVSFVVCAGAMANESLNISFSDFVSALTNNFSGRVTITPNIETISVAVGGSNTITAESDSNEVDGYIYAKSLNPNVATVKQTSFGKSISLSITGVAVGTTTIRLFNGGGSYIDVPVTVTS